MPVVDVGVARAGAIPKRVKAGFAVKNELLVSFIEAKKLVVYPMLLAQFVGIVHEIKPEFLAPSARTRVQPCFYPALVTVGYLKGTSQDIVRGYKRRRFLLNVVPTFDDHVTRMSRDPLEPSPFLPVVRRARAARPALRGASGEAPF